MQIPPVPGGRATTDAAATVICSLVLGLSLWLGQAHTATGAIAVLGGLLVPFLAAWSVLRRRPRRSTLADRVTLLRGVLAGGCATMVLLGLMEGAPLRTWPLVLLALPAWLLDGVDGWVARRTSTTSAAGARLDMETDAAFLVILSVALAPTIGWWVVAIGSMRYLFGVAARWRPALGGRLAFSQFRRVVAGIQGAVLVVGLMPVVPAAVAAAAAAVALVLLSLSFGRDVATLERGDTLRSLEATSPRATGAR